MQPYYIAFAAPLATREPTDDEYLLISQLTTLYFEEIFAAIYSNSSSVTFVRVDTLLDAVQYEAGIPDPAFNLYMAFDTAVIFSADSVAPNATELFDIMQEAIGTSYIVNYVWQAPETSPFISTQDAVLNPLTMDIVPADGEAVVLPYAYTLLNGRFELPESKISTGIFRQEDNGQ